MYTKLQKTARAKEQIERLEETVKQANNDSLNNELLYAKANFYYTFSMTAQGDKAINELINQFNTQKRYDKVKGCYITLIEMARKANNATLVARTYNQYMTWNDSVQALTAQNELNALRQQYNSSLQTIANKEQLLNTKQYIIIGLCILAAILVGGLAFGAIVLFRFILLTRKQKKMIETANEHNTLKTNFIRNISAQMEPTLQTLDATHPSVQALHSFATHIQQLSDLESSLSEPYEMQEQNITTFCENVIKQIQPLTKTDVTLQVNAPKLNVSINAEHLEYILLHLLKNAAIYTPSSGKITLDFKKRGAHIHQFIVSDTGCGIAEEQREKLFKPFTEIRDLTQGDGLGLPICALMTTKMNGELTLDTDYTKGARFILELHA
ncbi:two-component system sensor histidine kinase [gut metagenome]|uniref:histidine kinase n=1 Tax=gut metagenome TaxID=749906 RepID=J9FAF5_9ZZZZ